VVAITEFQTTPWCALFQRLAGSILNLKQVSRKAAKFTQSRKVEIILGLQIDVAAALSP
jgi:hypothetical protein